MQEFGHIVDQCRKNVARRVWRQKELGEMELVSSTIAQFNHEGNEDHEGFRRVTQPHKKQTQVVQNVTTDNSF